MLTPLLRIGIGLDSTREQKVADLDCQVAGNSATVSVHARGDFDLELWAAEQAADTFRQVYGSALEIVKARK